MCDQKHRNTETESSLLVSSAVSSSSGRAALMSPPPERHEKLTRYRGGRHQHRHARITTCTTITAMHVSPCSKERKLVKRDKMAVLKKNFSIIQASMPCRGLMPLD